jgi:hypothetical protein
VLRVAVDHVVFERMLARVRQLRGRVDDLGVSRAVIDGDVYARLRRRSERMQLPPASASLVAEIVQLLDNRRLSPHQAYKLERAYFAD